MNKNKLTMALIMTAILTMGTGCSSLQGLTKSPSEMTQEERDLDKNIADVIDIIGEVLIYTVGNK